MSRIVQPYKNTSSHRVRSMATESQFSSGMKYTKAPLGDGYARTLVNFKLNNDGESLRPRGGARTIHSFTESSIPIGATLGLFYTANVFVSNAAETDVTIRQVSIYGDMSYDGLNLSTAVAYVELDDAPFYECVHTTSTGYLKARPATTVVHGVVCENPTYAIDGVCAEYDGSLYCVHDSKLAVMKFKLNDSGHIVWTIVDIIAKEPTSVLAANYGYNMLKTNPYQFVNTAGLDLIAEGVLPYDADGNIILSARPGERITFKLVYTYDTNDITNSNKYYVQWEILDPDSGKDPTILQKWNKSQAYTPGDDISYTFTPSLKNFTLIVRVFKQDEIQDQEDEWESNTNLQSVCSKADYITPHCVTTLANYYLTSDSAMTSKNLSVANYNIGTMQDLIHWKNRLCCWGVDGCKSTLWLSEINDPSYFPYPNNVEVFSEDIVGVIPYLDSLIVFTKTTAYMITLNDDGLTFNTKKIQDKLNMTSDDAASIIAVQNMVFFRNDLQYYMIVPQYSYNSGTYGVQMAPISRPVEYLFTHFIEGATDIVNSVYGLSPDLVKYPLNTDVNWVKQYVDGNEIHIVYNLNLTQKHSDSLYTSDICTCNFHIVYDSVLRAWSTCLIESDMYTPTVLRNTATGGTLMCKIYTDDDEFGLTVYHYDKNNLEDDIPISYECTPRKYNNRQYIDTGNRNFAEDLKKRFREIQFCVNILERGQLNFNTGFICDDVHEIQQYHWEVEVVDEATHTLGVTRVYDDQDYPSDTPEISYLGTWQLDTSVFPDTTMCKIRYHVCGKGYNGSAQILSDNLIPYELLHISFVYRQMFAR